jgi:chromosomal replication initiator protein
MSNPWEQAQARLQTMLDAHSYKNWFAQTRFESCEDGRLVLGVPSQFFADWLRDHYLETICECVGELIPDFKDVRFVPTMEAVPVVREERPRRQRPVRGGKPASQTHPPVSNGHRGFNPRYVFDRFVVGAGNRFAYAAARAVAESVGRAYNPLFLYGGTGLGKTHLMQAVGQEIIAHRPGAKAVFISSEDFTNQLIESIATKSTSRFRSKYRRVDVLLIDDIHFIGGKEATQEEFFHTFNALFDMHKQIVISSDRQPKEISLLEERLVSRFEWGLVTDIQPPDLETRVAILQDKAAQESVSVTMEVLEYVATHVTSNIRELEGALITLLAFSRLTDKAISLGLAEEVLRDLIGRDKIRPVTVADVQRAVAEHFDVRISDLRGRSRQRQVAFPRQIAMHLCKEFIPSMSLNEIGEAFGGKDHTTVLHAHRKIGKAYKESGETRQILKHLERTVRG